MTVIKYIILVLVLITIGVFISDDFYNYSFSELNTKNLILESRASAGKNNIAWLFPTLLGTLPLLYLLIQKITKITFVYKGIIACVIIIASGILLWRLRIFGLNTEIEELLKIDYPKGIQPSINADNLKFEAYLCIGFIIGTVVSLLIFGDRTEPLVK